MHFQAQYLAIFSLFFMLSSPLYAQDKPPSQPNTKPTKQSWKQTGLQILLKNPGLHLFVDNKVDGLRQDPQIQYSSNMAMGVSLQFLGINWNIERQSTSGVQDEKAQGVSSEYLHLGTQKYLDQLGLELHYQDYEGFFVSEISGQKLENFAQQDLRRQDLKMRFGGLHFYYRLPIGKMKLNLLIDDYRRENTSGGALLCMFSTDWTSFAAHHSLVPATLQSDFGQDNDVHTLHAFSLSPSFGGIYNLSVRRFYLQGGLFFGVGGRRSNFAGTTSSTIYSLGKRASIQLATGVNGKKNYGGIKAYSDSTEFPGQGSSITTNRTITTLFLGRSNTHDDFSHRHKTTESCCQQSLYVMKSQKQNKVLSWHKTTLHSAS